MARLSLVDQIAAAAAAGDLEKVKELGEKLNQQPKAKPKKKASPKPKPKSKAEDEVEVIDPASLESDHTVPAKSNQRKNKSTYEDEDNRRVATREPFRPKKRKNTFVDTQKEFVSDINFDKSWYEKTGDSSVKREKVKKIKVICTRCKEAKTTTSNDFIHVGWTCDDCLKNVRR